MKEWSERDIVEVMKLVSEVRPGSGETVRAMKLARRAMLWRSAMRWTLRGGVAAGILVAVVLGVMTLTQQKATAAEQLIAVTQKSKAFRGWVHEQMITQGAAGASYTHFNNETGQWAWQLTDDKGTEEVEMYWPSEKKVAKYERKDGTVKVGELYGEFATHWKQSMQDSPLTITESLARIPEVTVTRSQNGPLEKFDIAFPPNDVKKGTPAKMTIWVDPATTLVMKGETIEEGTPVRFTMTYGGPAVNDVYDLGVPRDAKVLDVRPSAEVNAVFARLGQRVAQGFGDYTAVETESVLGDDKVKDTEGAMSIFGRSGDALVSDRYLVGGDERDRKTGKVIGRRADAPAGWPTPTLDAALATAKVASVSEALVYDGKTGCRAGWHEPNTPAVWEITPDLLPHYIASYTLPSHIWPTREKLGLFGSDVRGEIVKDADHAGLIGLKVEQETAMPKDKRRRVVTIFWIDPSRDDVPMQTVRKDYEPGKDVPNWEFVTTYLEWNRTTPGRWYPSVWQTSTRSSYMKEPEMAEHHLQVWEGEKLGKEWFSEPKAGK